MNPYTPPDVKPDSGTIQQGDARTAKVWWKKKRTFIVALVVCGITQAFIPTFAEDVDQSQDYLNAFMGFILNFILLGWCSVDAEERAVRISGLLRFALIIISVIGVPLYFLRSRGFVGALKNVFGLGLFAIWLITLFIVTIGIMMLERFYT